jgi:hypothetical protein
MGSRFLAPMTPPGCCILGISEVEAPGIFSDNPGKIFFANPAKLFSLR